MNRGIKRLLTGRSGVSVLSAVIAGLGLISVGQVAAQTFMTLHSFTALTPLTNSDGGNPVGGLILSGSTLYGTAFHGGTAGLGAVFAANAMGTGFTTLHSFTNGSDGCFTGAGLILSGNCLYGTAVAGGANGYGTVFAVNTDGANFTTLYSFTNGSDGATPDAGLILSGSTLYGTASGGGSSGHGTVFSVNTNGTNFTTLYAFTNGSDGANPVAGLILSGSTLYGTALAGGSSDYGTVFSVNTNGTNFMTLYSFTNGSDGANPAAGLILSGGTLYGTASAGGSSGNGTVFSINTNGANFMTLHTFTNGSDGATPNAGLILSGCTLYGTAFYGGSAGHGTMFTINTNGTNFIPLRSFTNGSDGALPAAGLILSDDTFYGTATSGGSSGNGTVFSFSFAPQLTINLSGTNVILAWPTDVDGFSYAGFSLKSTSTLLPAAWNGVTPAPVVTKGYYTVTNPISGAQQFYQLNQGK
jgi:uncharacterized repeat protein (TIGR03803 family)